MVVELKKTMLTLFAMRNNCQVWVACLDDGSWVKFPACRNGWDQRVPAVGLDLSQLRRVPNKLGFNTGFPEADGAKDRLGNKQITLCDGGQVRNQSSDSAVLSQ